MNTTNKKTLRGFLLMSVISISSVSCADDEKNMPKTVADNTISHEAVKLDSMKHEAMNPDTMNQGEEAHKEHCYKCHTDEVYTRDNRFVKSLDALSKQVVRCRDSNNVPWFDEDTDAVVQFLNTKYYKF